MTEIEAKRILKSIPVGSKLQIIMKNGDINDVVLGSHDTEAVEEKKYGTTVVPYLPPAIIVQGKRWGVYRLEIEEIVNIAQVG